MALYFIAPNFQQTCAFQHSARRYGSVLQGGGHRKRLGCGAWLICACDAVVLPQVVQVHIQLLFAQVRQDLFRDDGIRLVYLYVPVGIGNFFQQPGAQQRGGIAHIVQIVARQAGHGQDFPGIHLHDDAAHVLRPVPRRECVGLLFVELLQVLLHHHLQVGVYGGMDIIAVHRGLHRALQGQVIIEITVLPAIDAIQDIIVILFQSVASLVVHAGKADCIRRQGAVGINALVFFLEPDSFYLGVLLLCFLEAADLFIGQLLQRNIPGGSLVVGDIIPDRADVQVEVIAQSLQRGLQVFLLICHDFGVYDQIVHFLAGGQPRTFGVHDVPPSVGDGGGSISLLG